MGKFGLGKSKDNDEESTRSSLFSKKSKDKSNNPQAANPYANLPTQADAYNQAKARAGVSGYAQREPSPAPPSAQSGYGYPQDKKGNPYSDNKSGGYGGLGNGSSRNDAGYKSDRYGAQSGYGGDRYNSGPASDDRPSKQRPGGYGGLGDEDSNRDALFGEARDRLQKQPQSQSDYGQPPPYEEGESGAYPGHSQPRYEAYGDRQLTAEEEEEEDVQGTKDQIKYLKREDVSSTRNALRIAAQAEETGMNTLARIGAQGERIHNTEKNLDLTSNHNREAEDKARELKTLNRSMFAVHVSNPFTSASRQAKADADVLERHHMERAQREATRRAGYDTDQRMQKTFAKIGKQDTAEKKEASLAERAKYQFEADSEDDEMENEIDSNLDALGGAASRLNGLARATGKEVEAQNEHLVRINQKSTAVDDQIAMNRARLDRFK